MFESLSGLPTMMIAGLLAGTLLTLAVTSAALGPRSLKQARMWWGHLNPRTADQARAEIARIEGFRRDPELANMFFLSRFLVMIVLESVGQMLSALLAVLPGFSGVSDKIWNAPFAVIALWLAMMCLIAYRRISDFENWRARLIVRTGLGPEMADETSAITPRSGS
jgi:hypothetical protein